MLCGQNAKLSMLKQVVNLVTTGLQSDEALKLLAFPATLKIEPAEFSKTLVIFYQTTTCPIPVNTTRSYGLTDV
jgi:hypothetical protein